MNFSLFLSHSAGSRSFATIRQKRHPSTFNKDLDLDDADYSDEERIDVPVDSDDILAARQLTSPPPRFIPIDLDLPKLVRKYGRTVVGCSLSA